MSPRKTTKPKKSGAARGAAPGTLISVMKTDGSTTSHDPKLPDDKLLYLYRTMAEVREFDRRMLALQRQGRIGFYGPVLGQEAATVGSAAAAQPQDWVFPALREGAIAMMRGMPLEDAVAQLIGNDLDRCKGRQMPCHYSFSKGNYYAMSSVIGTQISHAVGAAMAAKIRGDSCAILGYLGDGATSSNDFHAAMGFAGVFESPIVLFCQNNQWAISVPVSQQSASETLATKGVAYGIPSVRVDGNDVLAVYAVTHAALERARSGKGPTFVEALTYRRLGHSSSDDPSRYRDENEVKAWTAKDPIVQFRNFLEKRSLWNNVEEQKLEDEITSRVNAAIATAETGNLTPNRTMITDVFADIPDNLRHHYEKAIEE
jgi:pyruvate dehydrogenase E1 component alpha subunit/2-oxoisovalerate dehydrogenase E1 component alpha subunit